MAKPQLHYVCQGCGAAATKWAGRCDSCGAWNAMIEEQAAAPLSGSRGAALPKGKAGRLVPLKGDEPPLQRIECGLEELDRVTGGGLVPGSAVLVGGDPGIGKSTLLLQALAALARAGRAVVYVSGEEAIAQIRLRAERLGLADAPVMLAAETNVEDMLATLATGRRPPSSSSTRSRRCGPPRRSRPGHGVAAARRRQALIRFAKQSGDAVLLVGHVTKEGQIAGPQGGRAHGRHRPLFRGRTRPPVPHPPRGQEPLRADRRDRRLRDDGRGAAGGRQSLASCSSRRARPMRRAPPCSPEWRAPDRCSIEIQALVSPSTLGTPRRAVVGLDSNRLAMVLAVLEARAGVRHRRP